MTARHLAAALLVFAAAGPAAAQPPDRNGLKLLAPFRAVVAAANPSTVRIKADDKELALGAVVSADGFILTKASELRGVLSVRMSDGALYDATTVAVHKPTDLALLKIDAADLTAVTFADSKAAAIGNWLAAAGVGSDPTAVGIVSVATRKVAAAFDPLAALNANRGFLGLRLADKPDPKGGVRVEIVSPKGAADKAGMLVGDVLVEMDGQEVTSFPGLMTLMEDYRPNDKVTVKVRRKGETVELTARLTADPNEKDRGQIQNSMGGPLSGRRTGFPAVLQTDMVVKPENCGGPVVDLDGTVLGLCIARAGRVETWVLPGEVIRPVLDEMKAGKHPVPAKAVKRPAVDPDNQSKPEKVSDDKGK